MNALVLPKTAKHILPAAEGHNAQEKGIIITQNVIRGILQ